MGACATKPRWPLYLRQSFVISVQHAAALPRHEPRQRAPEQQRQLRLQPLLCGLDAVPHYCRWGEQRGH